MCLIVVVVQQCVLPVPGTCIIRTAYITMYKYLEVNVFLNTGIFFSSGPGSFLVLSGPGHAGSLPKHHGASVGPGRGPWHVVWRSKPQVITGRHSEHVEPSRPMQIHVQVEKISDGSCDI